MNEKTVGLKTWHHDCEALGRGLTLTTNATCPHCKLAQQKLDIKKLAEECGASKHTFPEGDRFIVREHELELFAQKIREARDAEWMAEPVGTYYDGGTSFYKTLKNRTHLYIKPKEVK